MTKLVALLAALALAPAASADPIGIRHDRRAVAVALAGPDVMVLSEPSVGNDNTTLVAVPRTGGRARTLLHLTRTNLGSNTVVASPQRVAAMVTIDGRENESRIYTGPPSGPLKLVHRAVERYDGKTFSPYSIDVDDDRLLLVEGTETISFGDEDGVDQQMRASILDASGWTPIPWANGKRRPVAIAGPYAAVMAFDPGRVEVVELATGTPVATVTPRPDDIYGWSADLLPDGQIAVGMQSGIELAAPGVAQHNLPNSGRLGFPLFAHDTVVAFDDEHATLNLFRPDGTQTPLGPPSRAREHMDADADGVAWLFNGCVRYAPLSAPAAATAKDPCPTTEISLFLIGGHTKLRGDHARVGVQCVNGPGGRCRGRLVVRFERGQPIVAQGTFDLPVSDRWQYAKVHFNAATVAKLRREGGGSAVVDALMRNGTVTELEPFESEFTIDT